MSWTYSGDPDNSTLDAVRFELGDTQSNKPLLQDAEILFAIQKETTVEGAAAYCCEVLSRKYAKEVDKAIGPLRISLGQLSENYAKQAKEFRDRVAKNAGKPSYKKLGAGAFKRDLMNY